MNQKYLQICLILLCLSIGLSGCWDARELDSLVIVLGLGIDPDGDNYEVIIHSPITEITANQPEQEGLQPKFRTLSGSGRTIFEAGRNLTSVLSRRTYWPHTSAIVLNNQLSSYGIHHVVDFFVRDTERRLLTYVVLTDRTAKEILNIKPSLETLLPLLLNR